MVQALELITKLNKPAKSPHCPQFPRKKPALRAKINLDFLKIPYFPKFSKVGIWGNSFFETHKFPTKNLLIPSTSTPFLSA
jgi:hypothetical protein